MYCFIYKSAKKDELYLFVANKDDFSDVPDVLMKGFGNPEFVMELDIHPARQLARGDATDVITALEQQGFFLQMPPSHPNLRESLTF